MLILDELGFFTRAFRHLCAWLCQLIYRLIAGLFELFINVSKVELLSSEDIKPIYQRITMVLAIIMIFYVTFELVKYIVEPDTISDKEKGAGNIVKKMIIVVVLIAFVPTIFSLAYKFQNIVIEKEILSKIILGKSGTDPENFGKEFSANVFSMFYYYDEEFWGGSNDCQKGAGKADCRDVVNSNITALKTNGSLDSLTFGLDVGDEHVVNGNKNETAYITFDGLFAVVVGGFMVYILILYCIDLGTRVAQLAFLQIIAPIPIIGYLSPKKDNMFDKWTKQCLTTYLDLFIRMAVIYFILLICQIISNAYHNGTLFNNIDHSSNTTFIYIALILGLLLFAQKAPKMLQELFPKMGAASGNFGLKAGERVAPLAARALGMGLGATRLLGGAVSRGVNTARRNREERERTGMTRREQKEKRKQDRKDMKDARRELNAARRDRNRVTKGFRRNMTDAEKEQYRKDYEKAQGELQQKRDKYREKESQYADDRNRKYRSVLGNAVAGAVGGAVTGAKTGVGATKLEDVWKKGYTEARKNDKQNIENREKWLDSGGYSNAQRIMTGIEKGIGISTESQSMQRDIKSEEAKIKANEALIKAESDVKAKEDAAKDRSGTKLEAGEQKTEVPEGTEFEYTDLHGKKKTEKVSGTTTTSDIYAGYKARAEKAKATSQAASKAVEDLRMKKIQADAGIGGPWTAKDEAALSAAEERAKIATNEEQEALDNQRKMKKKLEEYAIDKIVKDIASGASEEEIRGKEEHDGVLIDKVEDTLTSISESSRSEVTRRAMWEALGCTGEYGNKDGESELYKQFIGESKISSFKAMDEIQTKLITIANERSRENVTHQNTKAKMEASAEYDAAKADDAATGGKK